MWSWDMTNRKNICTRTLILARSSEEMRTAISNATCTIDGITYALVINDNGINNLHSGPDFLRDRIWDAEISETEAGTKITFSLFSPDGDQNYPGNADIRVSYTLTEDDAVRDRLSHDLR